MLGKRCILISLLTVCFAVFGIVLFKVIDNNIEPDYDISILHDGGLPTPTYVRLSYDGQYEIYHGAFFHDKNQPLPSLFYDVKKGTLSKSACKEFAILLRDLEKNYTPPETLLEINDGLGYLTIRVKGITYTCSLDSYDSRDCKEIMINMYAIIQDEAPEFKEHYDELTKWDIQQ